MRSEPAQARLASTLEDVSAELKAAEEKLSELRSDLAARPAGELEALSEVFASEVRALLGDTLPDEGAVRRAVRLAVAEQAWGQRLGTLLDARDVAALLGVTRQRVSRLVLDHRLVALPRAGGGWAFPAWQFGGTDAVARATLARAQLTLADAGGISLWSAASWLQSPHPELDGRPPVDHLREGGAAESVLAVAERDAARAAQ